MPGTVFGARRGSLFIVLARRALALMLACGVGFRQRQGHPPTHKSDNKSSGSKSNSLQEQIMLRRGVGNSPMTMTVAVVVAMTMVVTMAVIVTVAVIMTVGTAIRVNMLLSMLFIVTVITL